jgi:hypothetical protein
MKFKILASLARAKDKLKIKMASGGGWPARFEKIK